jgi:hypothetical protein
MTDPRCYVCGGPMCGYVGTGYGRWLAVCLTHLFDRMAAACLRSDRRER